MCDHYAHLTSKWAIYAHFKKKRGPKCTQIFYNFVHLAYFFYFGHKLPPIGGLMGAYLMVTRGGVMM